MKDRRLSIAVALAVGLVGQVCLAATPLGVTGSIVGFVGDSTGVAQMGATVLLYNRYDRLLHKTLTNERGAFGFDLLAPDTYSIRVSLASFVPALKQNVLVQPGMRSFLSINLASVFSSIELVYTAPGQGALMSDDWKWVLRSSLGTRPVLRMLPKPDFSDPEAQKAASQNAFSLTRGVVRLSAGDTGLAPGWGSSPDLGTAFALATSLFGTNQLQFSGNLGYSAQSGIPAAGFSTRFTRQDVNGFVPDVRLTMRQVFLPARVGGGMLAGSQNLPDFRTISASVQESATLAESVHLEYGFALDSVAFLERLHYLSPYARLGYDLGENGLVEFAYSSGIPPPDVFARSSGAEPDLQDEMARLALFPRISRENGRVRVQRAENFEAAYSKVLGSRTVSLGFYRESVSHAALLVSGPMDGLSGNDLLPDLFSDGTVFNIGRYRSWGYTGSVTQGVGDSLNLTLAYGSGGVLRTEQRELGGGGSDELRRMIRSTRRDWLTGKVSGTLPALGTRLVASYLWTDYRSLTPAHRFLTRRTNPEAGLNLYIRQPIPAFGGRAGRLEANAELRNLMAQGYLPISTSDGRRLVLIHSPRSVRGGLSFIF